MIDYISNGIETEPNLLTHVDSIFTQHSEFAPDILMLIDGHPPAVVLEEEFGERTIVGSQDFLPIEGMDSYKLLPAQGSISLQGTKGEEEPWDFELNVSYSLKTDTGILRDEILRNFPSLDIIVDDTKNPIFCAVKIRGDYVDILGIYLQRNFGTEDDVQDVDAINSCVHLVSGLLHEGAKSKSRFKVQVHQSIIDQVANEDPSIPLVFLSRTDGALEHPMCVSFSDKVCKELNLVKGIEFCLFRDDEHIFVTVASPTTATCISRTKLDDMSNSNGRINRKQIAIALKKALNLKRDRSGVSHDIMSRKMNEDKTSGSEEVFSRVGITMKMAFSNVFLEKPTNKTGVWGTRHESSISLMFDEMIPLLIHLCLARLDPEMRGQITKAKSRSSKGQRRTGRSFHQKSRLLIWGKDSIRYISDEDGSGRSRHFVNSHVRRIELKNEETIAFYRKRNFPLSIENDIQIGYRMIRGHYRGTGDSPPWDGTYRFGKKPSYYSAKSLRWMNWLEREYSIEIQHAEKGGELRIQLLSGYIQVDGWCKENNTVYEFHGDVYHGNLEKYSPDENCHPFDKGVTAGELFQKTIDREEIIRGFGFNLVSIWEKDWDKFENESL